MASLFANNPLGRAWTRRASVRYIATAFVGAVLTAGLWPRTATATAANPILGLYSQTYYTHAPTNALANVRMAHARLQPQSRPLGSLPSFGAGTPANPLPTTSRTQLGLINLDEIPEGKPVLELPLFWFILPERLLGADYVLLPLYIGERGPLNFLVDTGLTTNLLTPQICEELNIVPQDRGVRGLAGDGNVQVKTVGLKGVYIDGKIEIPKFTAAVIDFPQRGYAMERGINIHGMVGMEFLEQFDIKYAKDPATKIDMLSIYRAHEGFEAHLNDPKWKPIKGVFMPARLMAVQIAVDNSPVPFLGLVDTGASHSIMNHEAARILGYDLNDPQLANGPGVKGVGVLGQEVHMPTVPIRMCISSFADDVQMQHDWQGKWWLTPMEHNSNCVGFEFDAVAAIGEMNFNSLTGLGERGLGPYKGPLVLTGQDILTQRELIFSGASKKLMFGDVTGRYTNA